MNTTTNPGRKRSARRRPGSIEPCGEARPARQTPALASGGGERARAAPPPAEYDADHALEKTLEALSVDHRSAQRLQKLPKDIGWLLVTAGAVGVVMPGVLGVPFLVLGGLILTPMTNRRAERWLSGHAPNVFKGSIRQINRFLDDLERRYPSQP